MRGGDWYVAGTLVEARYWKIPARNRRAALLRGHRLVLGAPRPTAGETSPYQQSSRCRSGSGY